MKTLFIINDAPYASEKAYNALRIAMTLQKELALLEGVEISTMSQLAQWMVEADKVFTF
jgi:sulfur relay (sulfurtransferase) complex TusBCD TusD component (DsrE family)